MILMDEIPGEKEPKKRPVFESLEKANNNAEVIFSDAAAAKMLSLIMMAPQEVGWHGSGKRLESGKYCIDDIYIYPQTVNASTIRIGDKEYGDWIVSEIMDNPDRAATRCLHGHSHVNMAVFPSATDTDYQEDTIEMVQPEDFYIFMIINKRLDYWFNIVDRVDDVYYKTARENLNAVVLETESGCFEKIIEDYKNNVTEEKMRTWYEVNKLFKNKTLDEEKQLTLANINEF